jgi:type IV secretion system protein TrbE
MKRWLVEKIPYSRLLEGDKGIIRLGAGGTLISYEIRGPGHETTSREEVLAACERFAASIREFSTGDFIHLIVHRTKAPKYDERHFDNRAARMIDDERARQFAAGRYYQNRSRFYAASEDEQPIANYFKALFFGSTAHRMRGNREQQMERFFHRLHKWENAVGRTLKPRGLDPRELFADLILCVNGTDYMPPLPPRGTPLRHVIGQQDLQGGSLPKIGQYYVRPITLVWPWPAETTEQALAMLLTHPGEMMLSCRFVCLDQVDALKIAKLERNHFIRETFGTGLKQFFVNAFHIQTRKTGEDKDIEEAIAEIDETIAEIQKGVAYGWASVVAVLRGNDEEEVNNRAGEIVKDLAPLNHGARIEDAAAVDAIEGSWPGQGTGNPRRPLISANNFAEIAMPLDHWIGTRYIDSTFFPRQTPVPLQISGTGATPFFAPSHIRSVGHTAIIGRTRGGKSVLLQIMIAGYSGLAGIRIRVIDYGYSSFVLTHAMDGRYIELKPDGSSPLCPFQTIEAPDGKTFLFDWLSRLLERWGIQPDQRQVADLVRAIELARDNGIRTMTGFIHLVHEPEVRGILRNYTQGQPWGSVFDGEPADNGDPTLCTYELYYLDRLGERVRGPAFELIIREIEVGLSAERPTMVVNDEASKQLAHPTARKHINASLRNFGKFNAWWILATQSLQEIEDSEIRSLLLESTAIKIFLANPAARGALVAQLYAQMELSPKEIEIIAEHMVPQQDYLWVTEYGSRVGRLDLGPIGRALCASTGTDSVEAARAILAEYGPEGFLDAWLHHCGLGPAPRGADLRTLITADLTHANGKQFSNGSLIHAVN